MLRAALLRGPAALDAWSAWSRDVGVERLDPDSQWLMPLVYDNLRGQGLAHPVLRRCRNVYLHTWYGSHVALHGLAGVLRRVAAEHVPDERGRAAIALVGGAAVALRYYAPGARSIGAIELWAPGAAGAIALERHPVRVRHTIFDEHTDAAVWRRRVPVTVKGVPCAAMAPADQLVDICAAGPAWDPRSRLLWMADATRLLQAEPRLDADVVAQAAARPGLGEPVREALDYLRRFEVQLPCAPCRAGAPAGRA